MIEGFEPKQKYNIDDLTEIIRILRDPGGCPWDAEQTHQSIKKNLIEETYEVIEAINKNDPGLLCEELGDLLMQVVFHARMEQEAGTFGLDDVADGVCKKLVERHPHVFGSTDVSGVSEVLTNWDAIKRRSKGHKTGAQAMDSVPRELPALMRSAKVQAKAASVGFDWPSIHGAIEKLLEEIEELSNAVAASDAKASVDELGDVLFSVVNVSRFLKIDAEESLTAATDKFISRFSAVEQLAETKGINMKEATLDELNMLWDVAKQQKG